MASTQPLPLQEGLPSTGAPWGLQLPRLPSPHPETLCRPPSPSMKDGDSLDQLSMHRPPRVPFSQAGDEVGCPTASCSLGLPGLDAAPSSHKAAPHGSWCGPLPPRMAKTWSWDHDWGSRLGSLPRSDHVQRVPGMPPYNSSSSAVVVGLTGSSAPPGEGATLCKSLSPRPSREAAGDSWALPFQSQPFASCSGGDRPFQNVSSKR